jgi:Helix-turn-helix domain
VGRGTPGRACRVHLVLPDLAIPGAPEAVRAFADLALEQGVRRLVLLSGRGEEEAQRAERAVQDTGADVTVVHCAWFMQNFSEDYLVGPVLDGEVVVPADDQLEPFVDADDIAILRAQGLGVREIARRLDRDPSTISRELRRKASTRTWRLEYKASIAQWHAERRARRPKVAKLATDERLREYGAQVELPLVGGVLGDVHHPQAVRSSGVELAAEVVMSRGPGLGLAAGAGPTEHRPPAVVPTDPPHRPVAHLVAGLADLIRQEPIAELGIVAMRVEHSVRYVRLVELGVADRAGEPPVVGLTSDLEDPARHRDGDPVAGQLTDERVRHFPGKLACDRYAAARRSTSFSCSSSRTRLRSSRFSACSSLDGPRRVPSSRSAWVIQFVRHDSAIPKSAAMSLIRTSGPRLRATRITSSRNSRG